MKNDYLKRAGVVLALSAMTFSSAQALNIRLGGNLIVTPPECFLNSNQQESVHFGDILLTRIDGNEYKRPVPFELTCINLAKNTLKMTLQGEATAFNSNGALKTDNAKLGVAFFVNNVRQPINQLINFTYTALPTIEAVPVKNSTANYSDTDGGDFTALATVKVDYQ